MSGKKRRKTGVGKGAPSGIVISIMLHVAAFLLAGILVVFNVSINPEKKFVQPKPVERPKMKLKKPRVKVKKNAKPKSSERIVTKVQKANMPDIHLPEMSGMGDGLGTGGGGFGFDLSADLESISLLGSAQSIGSDLEGTYYDLKLARGGNVISTDVENFRFAVIDFVRKGFRASTLARYYRAPKKIYATCIVIPPTISSIAPAAFGDRDASGAQWMVHYKGKLVHSEGITFRFWSAADETMLIRVDGKFVIGAKWASTDSGISNVEPDTTTPFWQTSSSQSFRFIMGNSRTTVGDWITLEPGVPQDIDIVLADNGGQANFFLAVEEEGVEYPRNGQGGPILPAFKTSEISRDMLDLIYRELVDDEICLTNGPVFNDYSASTSGPLKVPRPPVEPVPVEREDAGPHVWTLNGKMIEADFITVMGDKVVLKTPKGQTCRIKLDELIAEDRLHVELASPPEFRINFVKNCEQKTFVMESVDGANIRPPEKRCRYGARLKQISAGYYNHEVKVEIFAVGQERLGQTYILLDRQVTSFTPTRENDRSHEFRSGREVTLQNYEVDSEPRGETYATHLIIVTDSCGEVIGVSTGSDWLFENLDNLKKLRPGNYMNKKCERVFPTQPPKTRY